MLPTFRTIFPQPEDVADVAEHLVRLRRVPDVVPRAEWDGAGAVRAAAHDFRRSVFGLAPVGRPEARMGSEITERLLVRLAHQVAQLVEDTCAEAVSGDAVQPGVGEGPLGRLSDPGGRQGRVAEVLPEVVGDPQPERLLQCPSIGPGRTELGRHSNSMLGCTIASAYTPPSMSWLTARSAKYRKATAAPARVVKASLRRARGGAALVALQHPGGGPCRR